MARLALLNVCHSLHFFGGGGCSALNGNHDPGWSSNPRKRKFCATLLGVIDLAFTAQIIDDEELDVTQLLLQMEQTVFVSGFFHFVDRRRGGFASRIHRRGLLLR